MNDDFFFVGLFLAVFLVSFVLPIYLFFALKSVKRRLALLEGQSISPPKQVPAPELVDEAPVETARVDKPYDEPESAWNPTPKVKPKRKSFVFSGEKLRQGANWAQDNWVFILAGVSLALAGVFLVQYGVEHGLLSPKMRVLAAIGLGASLIGVGEFFRRKALGDDILPSVFAGAGLVAIFSGVLSARMLYDLIGPNAAFIGLAITGAAAVLLGWIYGPLLATLGVFGALAAPFLVGGSSANAGPLHLYFALIAGVALLIDAYKRWAWLSALALIGAYGASALLLFTTLTGFHAVLFAFITALLAIAVPTLSATPRHSGDPLFSLLTKKLGAAEIEFPTRVAAGAFLASSIYIGLAHFGDSIGLAHGGQENLFWLILMVLGLMLLAAIFWMKGAPALADLAFFPPAIALIVIFYEAAEGRSTLQAWVANATRDQLDYASPIVGYLLVGALLTSLAFAWRSYFLQPLKIANAVLAAGFAPWVLILVDIFWAPSHVLGAGNWALYLAVVAVAMVGLTERFARIEHEDRTRTALFAMSSMAMISFMLVVVLGDVALTLSLAVMVLAAAWLGENFKLRLLDWYIQIGVVVVSYRLIIDPGLFWAFEAPLWQTMLAFLGVVSLLALALWVKRNARLSVIVVLESAIWTLSGIFAALMLARWIDANNADDLSYVVVSFSGMVWLMLSANQLYRLKAKGRLRVLRIILASIYGAVALIKLAIAAFLNPVFISFMEPTGWPIFGSLGAAYLLPALLLGGMAWRLAHLPRWLRLGGVILAASLATLFVTLEIRHFWLGDDMASGTVLKPELYSYTVAMILAAIGLLALAFARQSAGLRKLALVMVVFVVAKVYFVDMSELDGLLRVVSFLVLGLVAALMAWVNRLLKQNEATRKLPVEPS